MDTLEYLRQEAKEEAKEEWLAEGLAKGFAKGETKGRTEALVAAANNMIAMTEFSDERIASLIGVSVDFVKEVRQGKKK